MNIVNESSHGSLYNHCINIMLDRGESMESAEKSLDKCSDFALNKIYTTRGRWLNNPANSKYLPKIK